MRIVHKRFLHLLRFNYEHFKLKAKGKIFRDLSGTLEHDALNSNGDERKFNINFQPSVVLKVVLAKRTAKCGEF